MGQARRPEVHHIRSYRYILGSTNYLLPHPRTSSSLARLEEPGLSGRVEIKYTGGGVNPESISVEEYGKDRQGDRHSERLQES